MSGDASIPLASQVGGHAGVRSSADGAQIIKPCLQAERDFYETVVSKDIQGFKLLAKHVPKFFGVEPATDESGKDKCFIPFYFWYFLFSVFCFLFFLFSSFYLHVRGLNQVPSVPIFTKFVDWTRPIYSTPDSSSSNSSQFPISDIPKSPFY